MWCPACGDYGEKGTEHFLYCPECDNYACDIHWLPSGACPICARHRIPVHAIVHFMRTQGRSHLVTTEAVNKAVQETSGCARRASPGVREG